MDEKGNKNIVPMLVAYDYKLKKYNIYGSIFPSNNPKLSFFTTKNPFAGLEKYSKYFNDVKEEKIRLGMPEKMLIMAWGEPDDINESVGIWGTHKQYVYGSGQYVYVENGFITSWQDF